MTALMEEAPVTGDNAPVLDADETLWQMWQDMELPEGYRAEIIEGAIELSPTGRRRHLVVVNRLRRLLDAHLTDSGFAAYQDGNLLHRRRVWIPDLFVAPSDLDEIPEEDDLGVSASAVSVVVEVVSPGAHNIERDRVRKYREYARARIPVYVLVDDYDENGTVSVMTGPDIRKARYSETCRVAYGKNAVIPEGPAKGFVIGDEITRS